MQKSKKLLILSLSVLIVIAAAVIVVLQSGMLNTSFRFFSKPINTVQDIKNTPGIVDMTEVVPLDSYVRQLNQNITELENFWSYTEGAICYDLRYKSDEYTVQGFLCLPDDYLEKEYPVLIYNRGGDNISKLWSINVHTPYQLSRMGFIVLATQYRGWGEESGKDEFGGGDVRDVTVLIDLVEKFTFTNKKIFMFGFSRGALMNYLVLSRDDRISAAVAVAGPTDLFKAYNERDDMRRTYLESTGGTPEQVPEEYRKRSAIFWADKIDTPLLIAQGTDDKHVAMHHSVDLYEKMKAMGKDVELKLYEGEDHSSSQNHLFEYFEWLLNH